MVIKKRSISVKGVLRYLADEAVLFLDVDKKSVYQKARGVGIYLEIEDYFPSVIKRAADKLERKGLIEKTQTSEGEIIKITQDGKSQLLKFKLDDFKPKEGKWDGRWRMVFFDIPKIKSAKRDKLRMYLKLLGMQKMQESVWVSPYDVFDEVKYVRECLEIASEVKLAEMSYLENGEDLKYLFDV